MTNTTALKAEVIKAAMFLAGLIDLAIRAAVVTVVALYILMIMSGVYQK